MLLPLPLSTPLPIPPMRRLPSQTQPRFLLLLLLLLLLFLLIAVVDLCGLCGC